MRETRHQSSRNSAHRAPRRQAAPSTSSSSPESHSIRPLSRYSNAIFLQRQRNYFFAQQVDRIERRPALPGKSIRSDECEAMTIQGPADRAEPHSVYVATSYQNWPSVPIDDADGKSSRTDLPECLAGPWRVDGYLLVVGDESPIRRYRPWVARQDQTPRERIHGRLPERRTSFCSAINEQQIETGGVQPHPRASHYRSRSPWWLSRCSDDLALAKRRHCESSSPAQWGKGQRQSDGSRPAIRKAADKD